jgi:putative ATP-grasp target RiPP
MSPSPELVLRDPLAPRLLPTAAAALTHSTDLPSAGTVRPFGLTRITVVAPADALMPVRGRYDRAQQLNVTASGRPLMSDPDEEEDETPATPETNQNTQFDHQWFTDKD